MSIVRIAFFGTPEFAKHHLESLLNDEHFRVVGVVTQPDRPAGRKMQLQASPVKQLAQENQIPVISPENANAPEVLQEMANWKAEAAVVVAFGQILSEELMELFQRRVVNVHASLLPRWRGAAPIQRAIMAGDEETGVSLQIMVKKLDAGDVLGERRIAITPTMNALELHDELKELGAQLLHVEFMDFLRGHLTGQSQDESLVTYAKKISKSESAINFKNSAQEVSCHIRGMAMGPGAFALRGGKKIKLSGVEAIEGKGEPGQIIKIESDSCHIACASGALKISEVQPESKKRMSFADYQKGQAFQVGDQLQ